MATRPKPPLKAQEVIAAWRSTHPQSQEPTPEWADGLAQFYGAETYYLLSINRNVRSTDGVKYLADNAGAYWLVDEIALPQPFIPNLKREPFQVWTLTVDRNQNCALLLCDNGNGRVLLTKEIEYTDFPLNEIKLYFADNVIMLTREY
jgi:hypothetical protein